jgi:DNA-binding IclR family transcriptional regulator
MRESLSGVGVLDKAVLILKALEGGPASLQGLTGATGLPRATCHRLATALESHGLVERSSDGRFVLGPALARLGRAAAGGGDNQALVSAAGPALAALRDATGESAQLYVRSGETRVCLVSLQSPHSLRTIVEVGSLLPMERGSAAKVLSGDPEATRRGWAQSVEEREKGVASVSAPVLAGDDVIAAVSVSGPVDRTTRQPGKLYAGEVIRAARAVEEALSAASAPAVAREVSPVRARARPRSRPSAEPRARPAASGYERPAPARRRTPPGAQG